MTDIAYWGPGDGPELDDFRDALRREWERRGYRFVGDADQASVIFNFVYPGKPKPFRRRNRATYVTAVYHAATAPADALRSGYPMLVRALANLVVLVVPGDACYFVTLEQGSYAVPDPGNLEQWVR